MFWWVPSSGLNCSRIDLQIKILITNLLLSKQLIIQIKICKRWTKFRKCPLCNYFSSVVNCKVYLFDPSALNNRLHYFILHKFRVDVHTVICQPNTRHFITIIRGENKDLRSTPFLILSNYILYIFSLSSQLSTFASFLHLHIHQFNHVTLTFITSI